MPPEGVGDAGAFHGGDALLPGGAGVGLIEDGGGGGGLGEGRRPRGIGVARTFSS